MHLSLCLSHNWYSPNIFPMDEKMNGWTCLCSPPSSSPYTSHSLIPHSWITLLLATMPLRVLSLLLEMLSPSSPLPSLSPLPSYSYSFFSDLSTSIPPRSLHVPSFCVTVYLHVTISIAFVYIWSYHIYLNTCQCSVSSQSCQGH